MPAESKHAMLAPRAPPRRTQAVPLDPRLPASGSSAAIMPSTMIIALLHADAHADVCLLDS